MAVQNKLKFPVLKNVEYIDLVKNGITMLTVDGKTVEGMKWRSFQLYIGKKIPPDRYFYIIKFHNDNTIHKGQVKTAGVLPSKSEKSNSNNESLSLQKTIDSLNQRLNEASLGSGVSVDMLIEVTKSSYTLQIGFLNNELSKKNAEIEKLQTKIDSLNNDLDNADDLIEELKSKTGMVQYIQYAKEFLSMKAGSLKPITNLEDSNPNDIPPEITEILGVVDWQAVPTEVKTEIINTMKIFIQKLPLKGK